MSEKGEIAVKNKGDTTVDAVWTLAINDFTTRTTPDKEVLCSPDFDVTSVDSLPTRWFLKIEMNDGDDVGLYLCADEDQMQKVPHRARFSASFGDGSDQRALWDETFNFDDSSRGWEKATTRNRLFTVLLKESKIAVNASITVHSDSLEEISRYQQIQKLEQLFDDQQGDFTVFCEDEEEIKVHRWALEMGNPVLASMLSSESNRLEIDDLSCDTTWDMLKFLYTGELSVDMDETELLDAAHKYDIEMLKLMCVKRMTEKLKLENACEFFKLASDYDAPSLKTAAGQLISADSEAAKATEGWQEYIEGDFELMEDLDEMATKKPKIGS